MCRAWQNHWQYHQCTPGRSAMKVTEEVCCGADLHRDAVAHDGEAVRQVLDVVHVGDG